MCVDVKRLRMYPCGLRSSESSMLLWKLGEPKSGVTLEAAGVVAVVIVVVAAVMPLVHALGGLGRNDSLSARFFTWCITPAHTHTRITNGLIHQLTCSIIMVSLSLEVHWGLVVRGMGKI